MKLCGHTGRCLQLLSGHMGNDAYRYVGIDEEFSIQRPVELYARMIGILGPAMLTAAVKGVQCGSVGILAGEVSQMNMVTGMPESVT